MKTPEYFKLSRDLINDAKREKLDDSRVKYILDDGTYIIEYHDPDPGYYHRIDKYIKYEKDGSRKEYDSHLDLTKIINAGGTVLVEIKYKSCPDHSRNDYDIYDAANKKRYFDHGHYRNSYYIKDAYFCVEREFENGCKRSRIYVKDEEKDLVKKLKDYSLSAIGNFIKEVYADGTERFYRVENREMADKFMESGWDEAKQYRQMFPLVYEKLPNGTERTYKNGYTERECIPDLVCRAWDNGVLFFEQFNRFDILETVVYDDKNVTSETRKDGTVCTFYQGKLVSENRPNYSHNTVTSRVDDNGVVRAFFPDGQPMFIYDGARYQWWAQNGRVKQACGYVGGTKEKRNAVLTQYFDTSNEKNGRLAAEGMGFVFIDGDFNDLKKNFDECIAKQDMKRAVAILKYICLGADKIFNLHRQDYRAYDGISMMARNCLDSTQIKVLDNGLIAFGVIFEDRYFVKSSFMGGIEWYWRAVGIVLDIENGAVVAKCATPCINVRDRFDPNKDKWKHIDTHDFMNVKDGKLTVRLGAYESASCDIDMEKYNQFLNAVKAGSQITQTTQQINDYVTQQANTGR